MPLTVVSYQKEIRHTQVATSFAGTPLTTPTSGFALTVTAIGEGVLSNNPTKTARATITVTGSASPGTTTVTLPPTGTLTEEELAAYQTFLDDVQTAKGQVEDGIVWS